MIRILPNAMSLFTSIQDQIDDIEKTISKLPHLTHSTAEIHCNKPTTAQLGARPKVVWYNGDRPGHITSRCFGKQINPLTVTKENISRNIVLVVQKTTSKDPQKCCIPRLP